ncbi:MAG: hypothetical protein ABJL54_08150 [Halioglobus sp.]
MKMEVSNLVTDTLSAKMSLIPLRGTDERAREGGDLDFLVPPGEAIRACGIVAREAEKNGWSLILFRDIDYLCQIVLVRPALGRDDEAIKIDFFDGLRWYGVGNDIAGTRLFQLVSSRSGLDDRLVGAASFFQKIMTVGRVSERDWSRVAATGADAAYLASIGKACLLPITEKQINNRGVVGLDKWRLRAASGGVTGSLTFLPWLVLVTIGHLKFKLVVGTKAGIVIGVSGLDGSGKSTLVDRLLSVYDKSGSAKPDLVHLLPAWIPMPHQLTRRKKTAGNYTKPYSEPPVSSKLSGSVRLFYYIIAFAIAKISLYVSKKRGRQKVLDRSFFDFASDPTRSRIPVGELPRWLVKLLAPPGSLFLLDASPEVVVMRKGELTIDKARSLQSSYHDTSRKVGAKLLNGNGSPDEVFIELLRAISAEYMGRIEIAR